MVKLLYNSTELTGFFKATTPITMNQNFPIDFRTDSAGTLRMDVVGWFQ